MAKQRVEEQNQVAFVKWFRLQYPELSPLLNISSIGENVGPRRMARLKEMGLTPGYPDLFFALPAKVLIGLHPVYFHGLYIEMKTKTGRITKEQTYVHERLRSVMYDVEIARDWEEAKNIITNYINACNPQEVKQ